MENRQMMTDDMALVREYAASQSERAFEQLVARHLSLVYSTALRRVGDAHLAQEITQAVFIILARKAGGLGPKTILSNWLYRTAGYVAADNLKSRNRRQKREHEACMASLVNEPQTREVWRQIAPLLEAAVDSLGEGERRAVVLRFFEGKSLGEVGVACGTTQEAAKKRVSRALEKLRKFFSRHGVVVPAGVLMMAISANSLQAAPAGLAKTVSAIALGKGAATGGSTLIMVKGALKIMAWTKVKTAAAVGLAVMLTVGMATVAVKTFRPVTIRDAYVKLYSSNGCRGRVLTIRAPVASANDAALRGDVQNFDGIPSDDRLMRNFNDKTESAACLLPKGWTVVLFEAAHFDGAQYKLVGTGKPETIPNFNDIQAKLNDAISSLRWTRD
jgi:RNA polymerase sigma factor (sigma-70 family)